MRIEHGAGDDPWTLGRALSEAPEIHPSSVVRASDFGRYTCLGPRSHVAGAVLNDYSYAMGDNQNIAWWNRSQDPVDAALADFRKLSATEFVQQYDR